MLNPDQVEALQAILAWLKRPKEPFFVLSGFAGTGKTFTVKQLRREKLGGRVVFTAPTNKAVRVLRETLTEPDYRPQCATIYSLLGLRLEGNGEVKTLTTATDEQGGKIDLSDFKLVVVDEAGMVNKQLFGIIEERAVECGVKVLFMGDPAQLPPVNETTSPVWGLEGKCLTKVMRYDNALLALATHIREQQEKFVPRVKFNEDWSAELGGVKKVNLTTAEEMIVAAAEQGHFAAIGSRASKIIAWRNISVQRWNKLVREAIFPRAESLYVQGDRIIMTAPAKDLDNRPTARTDDEGTVAKVSVGDHPLYPEFKAFNLHVDFDDGLTTTLRVLHTSEAKRFNREVERRAGEARANGRLWKSFWEFKDAFHQVRYAYALTAHRAQGSTYRQVFVDWKDIMLNPEGKEMLKCLYVSLTRASWEVVLIGKGG
jgi:exodeoxyribonuclease-5